MIGGFDEGCSFPSDAIVSLVADNSMTVGCCRWPEVVFGQSEDGSDTAEGAPRQAGSVRVKIDSEQVGKRHRSVPSSLWPILRVALSRSLAGRFHGTVES